MEPGSCPRCPILERRIAELEAKVQALTQQVEQLTRLLEESRRGGKRQAAPFSKKSPKPNPQKPGRKPGEDYGVKAYRQPPAPEQIDEEHDAHGIRCRLPRRRQPQGLGRQSHIHRFPRSGDPRLGVADLSPARPRRPRLPQPHSPQLAHRRPGGIKSPAAC